MNTYQVFRAGNSKVVTIPEELAKRYGIDLGVRLVPQPVPEGILYKTVRSKKTAVPKEFDRWLRKTSRKYAPALRALAKA